MQGSQKGFTLIELVVVIVILGILAATALPKFLNLGQDARYAVIQATEGSMRAANAMIYAKANLANVGGATGTVTINGSSVNVVYGFAATGSDLASVMDIDTTKIDATTTSNVFFYKGYSTCNVTYKPATSSATPTYTTVSSSSSC